MNDVFETLKSYSELVVSLYERHRQRTLSSAAETALDMAIAREEQMQGSLRRSKSQLSDKAKAAQFKWHDRRELFFALRDLGDPVVGSAQDVVGLVSTIDAARAKYLQALKGSTHVPDLLYMIDQVRAEREQSMRELAWQAQRIHATAPRDATLPPS